MMTNREKIRRAFDAVQLGDLVFDLRGAIRAALVFEFVGLTHGRSSFGIFSCDSGLLCVRLGGGIAYRVRAVGLLADVVHALREDGDDVIVRERVDDVLSVTRETHEMRLLEHAQLVADGALARTDRLRDVRYAQVLVHERVEDLDARGVGEHLEKVCQIIEQLFFRHAFRQGSFAFG